MKTLTAKEFIDILSKQATEFDALNKPIIIELNKVQYYLEADNLEITPENENLILVFETIK